MNIHARPAVRVACVVGTRPEVIKMAPLVHRLQEADWADCFLVTTGQQNGLLNQILDDFSLKPDYSIPHDAMCGDIVTLLASVIGKLGALFDELRPDCVIAQGDTTSVFAASLVAFYRHIPFVHVEAGLRTGDFSRPFPEEFHRRAIAVGALLHCAPTKMAAMHLRSENIPDDRILISGNTVIDALFQVAAEKPQLPAGFPSAPRPILLTAHRRENFGRPLRDAFTAIRKFVDRTPDTAIFFPVHPNPAAREPAFEILSGHPRIALVEPVSYREMVAAMQSSWLVVTDSGGLQEEAPALGKPVLVLRDLTERPEAVDGGVVSIIGTSQERVLQSLTRLHADQGLYNEMARRVLPYGDGHAAGRIVTALRGKLAMHSGRLHQPMMATLSVGNG